MTLGLKYPLKTAAPASPLSPSVENKERKYLYSILLDAKDRSLKFESVIFLSVTRNEIACNPEKLLEVTKSGISQRVLKVPSVEDNMKD